MSSFCGYNGDKKQIRFSVVKLYNRRCYNFRAKIRFGQADGSLQGVINGSFGWSQDDDNGGQLMGDTE